MRKESDIGDAVITDEDRNTCKEISGDSPSALILLSAMIVGPNKKRVAKLSKLPIGSLEPYWTNYKSAQIFKGNKVYLDVDEGSDDATIYFTIALASAVGEGLLEVVC